MKSSVSCAIAEIRQSIIVVNAVLNCEKISTIFKK